MARRPPPPVPTTPPRTPTPPQDLRERILADFTVLRIPLTAAHLDAALAQAAQDGCSHLEFLHRIITDQAGLRRERSTARRISEAYFAELKTLASFDWDFNAQAIARVQIEDLATGDFIRRRIHKSDLHASGQCVLFDSGKHLLSRNIFLERTLLHEAH